MRTPLLIVAVLILGLIIALVACEDGEEDLAPVVTATPMASGSSAPTASATPTPVAGTPVAVPSGWKDYTDGVFGFSLYHPPDLIAKDLTGPGTPDASRDRVIEFQSPSDPTRGFTVTIVANPEGVSLEQWVKHLTACLPDTIEETSVAGKRAIRCVNQPEEIPESAVIFEHVGSMFFITSVVPESEFELVIGTLQVQ